MRLTYLSSGYLRVTSTLQKYLFSLMISSIYFLDGLECHMNRNLFILVTILRNNYHKNTISISVSCNELTRQSRTKRQHTPPQPPVDQGSLPQAGVPAPPGLRQPKLGPRVLYCTVLYCTVLYCTVLYCATPAGTTAPRPWPTSPATRT